MNDEFNKGRFTLDSIIQLVKDESDIQSVCKELSMSKREFCKLIVAYKENRIIILPAKEIFVLTYDAGENCDLICPESFDRDNVCSICRKSQLFIYKRPCTQSDIPNIGKSVFLTHKEATDSLQKEPK